MSSSRLYHWVGWLLAASGGLAAVLAGVLHWQVEQALKEELPMGEDAGLSSSQLQERLVTVQGQIARWESLQLTSQVQALNLLVRLSNQHGLTPQIEFKAVNKQTNRMQCTLKTAGTEQALWGLLYGLEALHQRSRGSISVRAYGLSGGGQSIQLSVEVQFLARDSKK